MRKLVRLALALGVSFALPTTVSIHAHTEQTAMGATYTPTFIVMPVLMVPTLILNGTHDPITPPAYAQQVAAYLPNSTMVLVPGYGHVVLTVNDSANKPCVYDLTKAFYAAPTRVLDVSCVERIKPQWVVPSQ